MPGVRRLILVTGCPRSGTTAVGANLALATGARYLYEPFNFQAGLKMVPDHFAIPGSPTFSLAQFDRCIDSIRNLRMDLKPGLFVRDRGWRRVVKRVVGGRSRVSYLACRLDWSLRTILWKDPIAVFTAAAAAERFAIPVLATVRPPVPVAASFRRMQWTPKVAAIAQRLASVGIDETPLIARYQQHLDNAAVSAAILWRMIYAFLLQAKAELPDIHLLNAKDVIDAPVDGYRQLFDLLRLEWSPAVEAKIRARHASSGAAGAAAEPVSQRAHVTKRDLQAINDYGKRLLTVDEAAMVEDITGELWPRVRLACLPLGVPAAGKGEVFADRARTTTSA